jgi:hypothetical protein
MKKNVRSCLLLLSSFFFLASCGSGNASSSVSPKSSSALTSSEETSSPNASSSQASSSKAPIAIYQITFVNEDGTILQSSSCLAGLTPEYKGSVPAKAMDDTTYYSFKGWTPNLVPAQADQTYTATYLSHDIAEESQKNLTFSFDSGTASYFVLRDEKARSMPAIIVPETYDDGTNGVHPVSRLSSSAFNGCESMKWIKLPSSLRQIKDAVFNYCTSLTEIGIPEGVTSIEMYSFSNCTHLAKISFPSTLAKVGIALFQNCPALASIEVASGNTLMNSDGRSLISGGTFLCAYANATGSEYTIPEGITSVGTLAFDQCPDLEKLNLPASLSAWGFMDGCTGLKSFALDEGNTSFYTDSRGLYDANKTTIFAYANASGSEYALLDGVSEIAGEAFSGASDLLSLTVPDSLTSFGMNAFQRCLALKSFIVPSKVTRLSTGVFSLCTGLESVTLSEGILVVESAAFLNCRKLNSLVLPQSLTAIEMNAFTACEGLVDLRFAGTMSDWAKVVKSERWHAEAGFTSIRCSDGVTNVLD